MNTALIRELCKSECVLKEPRFPTKFPQPFFTQFKVCLWKQHYSYWRNPSDNAGRLIVTILVALMVGSIFWDIGSKMQSQQDLISVAGSIYSTSMYLAAQNDWAAQNVVRTERIVFYREKSAGMYDAVPYALSQVMIELPYVLVQSVLFTCVVYPMMGLEQSSMKFFQYLFFVFFNFLSFTYFGLMITFATPNIFIASACSSFFKSLWNLFSGFVIPKPSIPIWWRWNYWLCPIAWPVYGLVVSQFGDNDTLLKEGTTVRQFYENYFGYRHDFLGVVAVISVGFCVVFACTFVVAVKFLNFQKR